MAEARQQVTKTDPKLDRRPAGQETGGASELGADWEPSPGAELLAKNVLRLQRFVGNAAVTQMISRHPPPTSTATPVAQHALFRAAIQRDPPTAAAASPASTTWTVPANLVPDLFGSTMEMTTRGQVALFLAVAKLNVQSLKTKFKPTDDSGIVSMVAAMDSKRASFTGTGNLTAADVGDMTLFAKLARSSLDSVLDKINAEIKAKLDPLKDKTDPGGLDGIEDDVAEEIHDKFNEGKEDAVAHLREVLEKINHYKEIVYTYKPWVDGTIKVLASAHTVEKLEHFSHASEHLFKALNVMRGILDAGKAVQLALTHAGASGMESDLQKFELAIDTIDVGMTFAEAVPLVGTLWTFYYKPLTEACIKGLHKIAKATDKEARDLTLVEWMSQSRPEGATPKIPKELTRFFPGGQDVLNVMYPAVNGQGVVMNSAAEQYFLSKRDLFNAGAQGEMKSQSNWELLHPSTWGAADSSPNIVPFLESNKNSIWAMLYGSLPHGLR